MTKEEIEIFKEHIRKDVLPHIINLNQQQIISIAKNIPDIPESFKNMLLEQLLIMKEKHLKENLKK